MNTYLPLIYGEGEDNAFYRLRAEVVLRSQHGNSRQVPFVVPFGQNQGFVGREDILRNLLRRIPPDASPNECQRTVIEGLGGIGKTQVAIEVLYRLRALRPNCAVFWAAALDLSMVDTSFREIGRSLGLPGIEHHAADAEAIVKAALSKDDAIPWLLVIDNIDDPLLMEHGKLMSYLPFNRNGSMLFTTRNREISIRLDSRDNVFTLDQLSVNEGARLLQQGLRATQMGDSKNTAELVEYLTYMPLAIRQASAYLARQVDLTIGQYLEYCKSSDQTMTRLLSKDFEDKDRYEASQNAVATTWLISFDHITRDHPLASRCLQSICYFEEKAIPTCLFASKDDPVQRAEAINILRSYAFLSPRSTPHAEPEQVDLHRLVRLAVRNWMRAQGRQSDNVTAVVRSMGQLLHVGNPGLPEKYLPLVLPHAQALLAFRGVCTDIEALALLESHVANAFGSIGKDDQAEALQRRTISLLQTYVDESHPLLLDSRQRLAKTLGNQRRYQDAEYELRTLEEMVRRRYGGDSTLALD